MAKTRAWSDDKLWEFIEMYEDPDISIEEIGEKFGITKNAVYMAAFRNEIKRGRYSDLGLKRCQICKEVLPVEEFHKNRAKHDGLAERCKECDRELHGCRTRRNRYTKEQIKYITGVYGKPGISCKDIAEHLNTTEASIRVLASRLRKKGLITRSYNNRR